MMRSRADVAADLRQPPGVTGVFPADDDHAIAASCQGFGGCLALTRRLANRVHDL